MVRVAHLTTTLLSVALGASGCAGAAQTRLRTIASGDLACDAAEVEVRTISGDWGWGGTQAEASGCGRRGRYVDTRDGWVLNTDITQEATTATGADAGTSGGPCYGNGTCNEGLSCTPQQLCEASAPVAADGTDGGPCYGNDTCNQGLVCTQRGVCDTPPNGPLTGEEGGTCYGNQTCNQGLVCVDGGTCAPEGETAP